MIYVSYQGPTTLILHTIAKLSIGWHPRKSDKSYRFPPNQTGRKGGSSGISANVGERHKMYRLREVVTEFPARRSENNEYPDSMRLIDRGNYADKGGGARDLGL